MPWDLVNGPRRARPVGDGQRWGYVFAGDRGEQCETFVEVSGTAAATDPNTLPSPLDEAVRTRGRSVLENSPRRSEPPAVIFVSTTAIVVQPREGAYEPGDRVYLREGESSWSRATVVRLGDPDEAVDVKTAGSSRRADVVWVRIASDGELRAVPYSHVRAEPL
jgi:hypothetical protein